MAPDVIRNRRARGRSPARALEAPVVPEPIAWLKSELGDRLERLSNELMDGAERKLNTAVAGQSFGTEESHERERLQREIRLFGQLVSGLDGVTPDLLPAGGAGFGSTVRVEDLDHGSIEEFTLVTGAVIDLAAGQVSLASPIGQSLLGRRVGDAISIRTPQRLRRLRIVELRTLYDRLNGDYAVASGARPLRASGGEACL